MLLPYTRKFMQTCFDSENESKLYKTIGGILYDDPTVKGKVYVLYGPVGSGKTSILNYISTLREYVPNLITVSEISFKNPLPEPIGEEIIFTTTNKLPDHLENWVVPIRTTGKRMPFEDYYRFLNEMDLFSDEFFKKCMWEFSYNRFVRGEFDAES